MTTRPFRTGRVHTGPARAQALTLRQPWASLIMEGRKDVENRTWVTRHRGLLVVHAGSGWDQRGANAAWDLGLLHLLEPGDVPRGYLGTVNLTGIHADEGCCDPWGQHTPPPNRTLYHWHLAYPHPFQRAVLGKGRLGLYTPPAAVLETIGDHR